MNLTLDQWAEKRNWLHSLGIDNETIHNYRLDQYPYMTVEAWEAMVREALRSAVSLKREQRRRIANATNGTGHQ